MAGGGAPRLAAGLLVSALIRRAEEKGGSGMVLAKGDSTAGALLSGVVVTPLALVVASPGAVSRNACPMRIRFTFSMLFHAASSR